MIAKEASSSVRVMNCPHVRPIKTPTHRAPAKRDRSRKCGFAPHVARARACAMLRPVTTDIEALKILDERLRWLSAWTIHHANHIPDNPDGLKAGGHKAGAASRPPRLVW